MFVGEDTFRPIDRNANVVLHVCWSLDTLTLQTMFLVTEVDLSRFTAVSFSGIIEYHVSDIPITDPSRSLALADFF